MARALSAPVRREERSELSVGMLVRWSGMLAMIAGAITVVVPLVHPSDDAGTDHALWVPVHIPYFIGLMLLQLVLVGIFAVQFRQAGRMGLWGFLLAFLGTAMMLMEGREHLFSPDFGDQDAMRGLWQLILASVVFGAGFITLGLAIRRARVLPPLAGILLAVGGVIFAFAPPMGMIAAIVSGIVFGAELIWIGYILWTGRAGRFA